MKFSSELLGSSLQRPKSRLRVFCQITGAKYAWTAVTPMLRLMLVKDATRDVRRE